MYFYVFFTFAASFTLPADSVFFVNIFDIHKNEKYWPKAKSFTPERFSPENITKHNLYAYFPFSAGPRMCIGIYFFLYFLFYKIKCIFVGHKYSMMALIVFVANIVRKYKITTSYKSIDEIEMRCYVSISPIHGTKCKLEQRL